MYGLHLEYVKTFNFGGGIGDFYLTEEQINSNNQEIRQLKIERQEVKQNIDEKVWINCLQDKLHSMSGYGHSGFNNLIITIAQETGDKLLSSQISLRTATGYQISKKKSFYAAHRDAVLKKFRSRNGSTKFKWEGGNFGKSITLTLSGFDINLLLPTDHWTEGSDCVAPVLP
ncbi:2799_t:CDS:2 [Diversispora eburnea]|uniref:2799_t:CDS:1 n=1 Tax=Diversispora eburnea TaxID=1213867 RepID=A0A9N9C3I4_9GLOM|nr:2799_t:CDS:2 [Diversispora eburnea]